MITGFGNNVISSLAADITAGQTTIQVMPGTGAKFAGLLSSDYANASNPLQTYAKITMTDAKETVFEISHLTSVNNDVLTVVRGQEGTTAKGWALNDVIANFATRGSENQFVQIEQLQSGHYISGVAGGTANALTLELPATYFVNGATDWTLRTPIVVYPTQNNTGASTLQLTMGGRVLGTFKLYKGNKAELVASDILKDTGLVCLLDSTKTFFNVMNPGAIYAGLGTAAFRNVADEAPGDLVPVGYKGNFKSECNHGEIDFATYPFVVGESLFIDVRSCQNNPPFLAQDFYFINVICATSPAQGGRVNRPLIQFVSYSDSRAVYSIREDDGTAINWRYFKTVQFDAGTNNISIGGSITSNTSIDAPVFNMSGVYLPGTIQKTLPPCSDCNHAPYGWSGIGGATANAPFLYGTLLTLATGGTGGNATVTDPVMQAWYQQTMWSTDGQIAIRTQTNTDPWTEWAITYTTRNPPPSEAPTGIPLPWPSPNPPGGWAICVGQSFDVSVFPQLGAAYPNGVIPDLRGVFIRGWDNGRGVDPGRAIMSLQGGQAPRSAMSGYGSDNWNTYAAGTGYFIRTGTDNEGRYQILAESEAQRETRPINMAFNYIVRLA